MEIGEYLRGLRGRLMPGRLGLPDTGQRRVTGLRREEVAVLAGISVDYYRRLEQGRERNPSVQIIESLARGLNLTTEERRHLFRLAGYSPPVQASADTVRPALAGQLGRWHDQAAFVLTGTLGVLAPNVVAQALFAPLTHADNLARAVFVDPAGRTFYRDWEHVAENTVAVLRHNSTLVPAAEFDPFIEELAEADDHFRTLWARRHVRGKTHAAKRIRHPEVGDLTLEYHALDVPESPGHQVIVYDAEPGTSAAEAFALLRLRAHGLRAAAAASVPGADVDSLGAARPRR
ncbi:transcriptional regulator with XRE-family HTH domain [Actinoalloteichus hoggarensis]|uniref:Helix-turn-helix protein n=1 Tax=Actinoalloteichus hoggarensis TaxID=1470176 RepID=A0A221VWD6_9PSEU|nr:helix-turn-helix transcriptional regulator [Actinoalloteichus hoggarensis]ASO17860.1 helix-turn-helix protein [Actinoalloteichus hoggarensis]MBB5924272.1 transcriptional regulator with XRE-family HTH domain [Actinoalloteichus hoggarensis]